MNSDGNGRPDASYWVRVGENTAILDERTLARPLGRKKLASLRIDVRRLYEQNE